MRPKWRLTPRVIQVEPKEEIKERLGRSPDCGEAVTYAFADVQSLLVWGQPNYAYLVKVFGTVDAEKRFIHSTKGHGDFPPGRFRESRSGPDFHQHR